ncbi:MAG: hypothetical protein U0802_17975, partial [Candidatus Binatia bacterium]
MRPRADTLLVWTGAACGYGCPACPIDADAGPAGIESGPLHSALRDGAADRLVLLVGGEPLLRRDVLRLLAVIRAAGGVPGLVTTGRPLVYPQWRERLRRAGLGYLRVQLFGTGAAHDRAVAVPGAYAQALDGLRAWLSDGDAACDVDVALSTRPGSGDLAADVATLAAVIGASRAQLVVAVDPDAGAGAALAGAVAALDAGEAGRERPLLVWEGLPDGLASRARVAPPRPRFAGTAPPACCLGRVAALAQRAAPPATAPRANSFNYVRTGRTAPWTPAAERCTAHAA